MARERTRKRGQIGTSQQHARGAGVRGQVFAIDFIVAILVFVLCIAFINSFWKTSVVSANAAADRNRLAISGLVATDALLYSTGDPANWENASAVRALGLAKQGSPHELDPEKLSAFAAMDNGTVRSLLGLRSQYYFVADGVDGPFSFESGNSSLVGASAVGITRYAVMNGTIVRVRFFAYQ